MAIDVLKALSTAPLLWVMLVWAWALWVWHTRVATRHDRRAWTIAAGACFFLWMLSFSPFVSFGVAWWEGQYAPPTDAQLNTIDTIVVLGGGVEPSGGLRKRPQPSLATFQRVQAAVEVLQRLPRVPAVLSGAADRTNNGKGETNAQVMKDLAQALGIPSQRIVLDSISTTTAEHAVELRRLLPTGKRQTIGILTSALHMPRSMEIFQHIVPEHSFIALPVGTLSSSPTADVRALIPSVGALENAMNLLHELIGLVWYRLRY